MNKMIRFMQNYLIFGLPFVVTCMIWETLHPEIQQGVYSSLVMKIVWEILCFNLMIWFVFLISFLILLVIVPKIREKTLTRLANLKERDEREQYITGKASRSAYISTLSLMILFLFFSMFSFKLAALPKAQMLNGHKYSVSINFGFSLLNKPQIEKIPNQKIFFDSKDISLSSSALIFMLLIWQLLSFKIAAKKEQLTE